MERLQLLLPIFFCLTLPGCFLNASLTKGENTELSKEISAPGVLTAPATVSGEEGSLLSIVIDLPVLAEKRDYRYELVPGTAMSGVNYQTTFGNLIFNASETQKLITIQTNDIGIQGSAGKTLTLKIFDAESKLVAQTQVEILPSPQINKLTDLSAIRSGGLVFIDMGSYILYSNSSVESGLELWRSDGTPNGTYQLKDICPGVCSSEIPQFVKIGTIAYFIAKEVAFGKYVFFSTDGTTGGTQKLFEFSQVSTQTGNESGDDIFPSPICANGPNKSCGSEVVGYLQANSTRVFFVLRNNNDFMINRYTWFSTQGTLGTTRSLAPINDNPRGTLIFNDRLVVTAEDDIYTWSGVNSNGQVPVLVGGGNCGGRTGGNYIIGAYLFLNCYGYSTGFVHVVRMDSSFVTVSTGSTAMYAEQDASNQGLSYYYYMVFDGMNLDAYRTDGTGGGTTKVFDGTGFLMGFLGNAGGKMIFRNGANMYQTNGTLVGTSLMRAFTSASFTRVGTVDSVLYFYVDSQLYRTDSTIGGTSALLSPDGENFSMVTTLYESTTELYFSASTPSRGSELWKISTGGVLQLVTERLTGPSHSLPDFVYKFLGNTFVAMVDVGASALFQIDGSLGITKTIFQQWGPVSESEALYSFQELNGKLFWLQSTTNNAGELKSYSPSGGVQLEKVTAQYYQAPLTPVAILGTIGTKLMFGGTTPSIFASRLGSSYSTIDGNHSTIAAFLPFNLLKISDSQAIAVATEAVGSFNVEPYVTDGTTAGTSRLLDVVAGGAGSNPILLGKINSKVIIHTSQGFYQTDGSTMGTTFILQPSLSAAPQDMMVLGNKIVFTAGTAATGRELWVTDGSAAGTVLLKETYAGATAGVDFIIGKNAESTTALFTARDAANGLELWKTDGTLAGTGVIDLCPGVCDTFIASRATWFIDRFYFWKQVPNPTPSNLTSSELWATDGTAGGTVLIKNILPKQNLENFYSNTTTLFFTFYSSASGEKELWRYRPALSNDPERYPGQTGINPVMFGIYDNKLIFSDRPLNVEKSSLYLAK